MRYLHTMIRVTDLERSLKFYRDGLGFKLVSRDDFPKDRFTLAFLVAPGDADQGSSRMPMIELTHNWDTKTYELGNGFGHIAVEVDDAYAACEEIKKRGGKVVREAGAMKHGTTVIAFAEDPDGYKIELVQRKS